MAIYHVSYDLTHKDRLDYQDLQDALNSTPSLRMLASTFFVSTRESANQLCTRLSQHIHKDDKLIVSEITGNFQAWLPDDDLAWFRAHGGYA